MKEQKKIQKKLKRYKRSANKLRLNQIKQNNPNERAFRHLLIKHNIKHIWQKPFLNIDRYVCVDFYFPQNKIVVEIDGVNHKKTIHKDTLRTIYLKQKHGIKEVIRITNNQVANHKDEIIDLIFDKLDIN